MYYVTLFERKTVIKLAKFWKIDYTIVVNKTLLSVSDEKGTKAKYSKNRYCQGIVPDRIAYTNII